MQQSKKAHKHFAHDTDLSFSILNIKRIYYSAEQDTQQILLKLQTKFTGHFVNHKITPQSGDAVRYLCLPYKQGNVNFLQQLT